MRSQTIKCSANQVQIAARSIKSCSDIDQLFEWLTIALAFETAHGIRWFWCLQASSKRNNKQKKSQSGWRAHRSTLCGLLSKTEVDLQYNELVRKRRQQKAITSQQEVPTCAISSRTFAWWPARRPRPAIFVSWLPVPAGRTDFAAWKLRSPPVYTNETRLRYRMLWTTRDQCGASSRDAKKRFSAKRRRRRTRMTFNLFKNKSIGGKTQHLFGHSKKSGNSGCYAWNRATDISAVAFSSLLDRTR